MAMPSDLEIARQAHLKPIAEIAKNMGIEPRLARALRRECREDQAGRHRRAGEPPEGQVRGRLRDHADAARRGEDDDDRGPRPSHAPHRQEGDDLDPPALDGPHVRHQGWRRWWRLQPGRPDGVLQPPPDRRHARGDGRAQHAVGHGRQPSAEGQRAQDRPAQHHLETGSRRERSRASQHRDRARDQAGRRPPPDRLRHHRRVGGDGHPRALDVAEGHAGPLGTHRRRLHRRRRPGDLGGTEGRRGHDRDHARGHQAQLAPDDREHPGDRARRTVRQYRARQLVDRR